MLCYQANVTVSVNVRYRETQVILATSHFVGVARFAAGEPNLGFLRMMQIVWLVTQIW